MTTWITDDRGNRCSVEYWGSEEKARAALAALKACSNCSNCSRCDENCIIGSTRSDGYTFFLSPAPDRRVRAGCHDFATFTEARKHWQKTRGGTKLGIETMAILDALEQIAALEDQKEATA